MAASSRSSGEFRNEFSWSHSRFGTFKECLRRYYYHYYAYWGGWDPSADPFVRKLYILRSLKNRYLWAGSAVHETVAAILERVRAGLALPDPEKTAEETIEQMRTEFRGSLSGAYVQEPRRRLGLMEHHYREGVADAEWRSMADMVRRSILGFFQGPFLSAVREVPAADWLALENLESFVLDGAKVYVKMDLAHRKPDAGAVILDWKTGRRRPRPQGLQLGCYALYATEAWDLEPDRIQVIEANLSTGAVGSAQVSAELLETARQTIAEGIREMRALLSDPENNIAEQKRFPAAPNPQTCRRCPFREVCPEYQQVLATADQASRRDVPPRAALR